MTTNNMKMSFLDLKNLPEGDKKLLFGEAIKGTVDWTTQKPAPSSDSGKNPESTSELPNEPSYRKAAQKESLLQRMVIPYNNALKSIWDIYVMFLICYSSITTAYFIAFDFSPDGGLFAFEIIVQVSFALDIIMRFFHEYKDPQNFECIRDVKQIASNYLKGWFIIDFLAVFPFQIFGNVIYFRLLRILRLPRFLRFLDQSRFDQLLDAILHNTSRQKKMNYLYASKYVYKIIRLVLIATTLTYFLGCLWYLIITTSSFHDGETGFYDYYNLELYSDARKLIMCCYFALTTLATVGYGDLAPQSNVEKIVGIIIMILGIALFSYIMGNFNDVLTNYDKQMGIVDKSVDLQVWMTSLSKFTNNQPLPRDLVQKIDEHFKFFWKNDRLSSLTPDDKYLKQMPKPLKHQLIRYLFDDIFSLFRGFLLINEFRDSPFYYDIAFEFLPRKYDHDEMIMKQGDPVHEVYLIKEGSVFIYFDYNGKKIGKYFSRGYFFGNYNIFRNTPAEFNYKTIKLADNIQSTKVLAIPKSKLLKLLSKYPEICSRMMENSKKNNNSLRDVLKHELKMHLREVRGDFPDNDELNRIFKDAVNEKAKAQTMIRNYLKKKEVNPENLPGIDNRLNATENAVNQLMDKVDGFNQSIGTELDEITNRLQKVRDQLAGKDKIK